MMTKIYFACFMILMLTGCNSEYAGGPYGCKRYKEPPFGYYEYYQPYHEPYYYPYRF